jgi:hypothetical protein
VGLLISRARAGGQSEETHWQRENTGSHPRYSITTGK